MTFRRFSPARFFWAAAVLFSAWPLFACSDFLHDWRFVSSTVGDPSDPGLGVRAGLMQFEAAFFQFLEKTGEPIATITISELSWGSAKRRMREEEYANLARALPPGWSIAPFEEMGPASSTISSGSSLGGRYFATVAMEHWSVDQLNLVNRGSPSWGIVRVVLRQPLVMRIKTFNPDGVLLFLDEVQVAPSITLDIFFQPFSPFAGYFRNHDPCAVE